MVNIPLMKFNRFAAAFDEVANGRLCESSGSEHSPDSSSMDDLSDLVNSFLEGDHDYEQNVGFRDEVEDDQNEGVEIELDSNRSFENETMDSLKRMFSVGDKDDVKRKIHSVVEKACYEGGTFSSQSDKRGLMTRLRERGLNAGLCKTKWEKNGGCPSGVYEYIDVKFNGVRYIVEVSLTGEFEIARSTSNYASLMEDIPEIYVGKVEDLKKIVKLMCRAIRTSMKSGNIHVPPWRRLAYMQAKWFGLYKRTINQVSTLRPINDNNVELATKRSYGFVPRQEVSYYCRDDNVSKIGVKVGNLTAAFRGS